MSATIGTDEALTMAPRAAVDSSSGQETRTISAPAAAAASTWAMVAAASLVKVLVMVCTEIGASPPTSTLPTLICRLLRRWISRYGRTLMARTSVCEANSAPDIARLRVPQKPRPFRRACKQCCRAPRSGRRTAAGNHTGKGCGLGKTYIGRGDHRSAAVLRRAVSGTGSGIILASDL
jgi:hypothetical protein